MVWSHFSINSVIDNSNWHKVSRSLTKKVNIWKRENCKPNSLTQTLLYRPNIYYSKIYQKKKLKKTIAQLSIWDCELGILDIDTQYLYTT